MTTAPFLPPPAPPQPQISYAPPLPTPPAPPRKQRGILRLLVVGGLTITGLGVVTAVATRDQSDTPESAPVTTPRATTTTEAEAPVVTQAEPDAWQDQPGVMSFLGDASEILGETSVLTEGVTDALDDGDFLAAATASLELVHLWQDAPRAPDGVPFETEWNTLRRKSINAYLLAADAFANLDVDKADQAVDLLTEVADLIHEVSDIMTDFDT
jgi:hypothetical protein